MNFDNLTLPLQHAQVNKEKLERKIFLPHSVSFYRALPRVWDLYNISPPSLEKTLLFLLLLQRLWLIREREKVFVWSQPDLPFGSISDSQLTYTWVGWELGGLTSPGFSFLTENSFTQYIYLHNYDCRGRLQNANLRLGQTNVLSTI